MPLILPQQAGDLGEETEAQLAALPPEALAAMLQQQLIQLDRLQESNVEMARLVQIAERSGEPGAAASATDDNGHGAPREQDEDVSLDDDTVRELSIACEENIGVLRRKQVLVSTMQRLLVENADSGFGEASLSDNLREHVARVLAYTGRQDNHASSEAGQADGAPNNDEEGMHL